ncbi:hypothetical protein [Streptomyces sp. RTd22]|uniref:hypothetical protein n=1 Tax=Streptomyces sp. RTd22 TaxID=1841249 RepID=UPI0007C4D3C6|nr:hypothetical protein [Streptomyces sp. RTd22]
MRAPCTLTASGPGAGPEPATPFDGWPTGESFRCGWWCPDGTGDTVTRPVTCDEGVLLRGLPGQEAIFSVTVREKAQLECTMRHWLSMSW